MARRPPAPKEPTSAEVRAWESENRRGHKAAAEHFRSLGFDITADRIAELYRSGGSSQSPPKAPPRLPPDQEPPPQPVSSQSPSAPRARARAKREPKQVAAPSQSSDPEPPPPAELDSEPKVFEPGTVGYYKQRLAILEAKSEHLKGAPFTANEKKILDYAKLIAELQKEERPSGKLTHAEYLERAASDASQMADAYLEPYVLEFIRRKRLRLVPE
jgi:hypothetical protein